MAALGSEVYAEFLTREPLPEERIELGLAQLTANYVAVHRAHGSPAPRPADFLLARDAGVRLGMGTPKPIWPS